MNRKTFFTTGAAALAAGAVLLASAPRQAHSAQGGRLVIKGSDTLLPLSQQWAQAFDAKKPGTDISVTGGGSSTGITALVSGTCDIANSSRKMRPREYASAKERNLVIKEFAVARDGLSIIIHPSNPVKSLTVQQVAGIYTGAITNWNQVGGPNLKIVASGRDPSSGTYGFFQEDVLKNARYRADMISTPSNNAIASNVASDPGGIGYVGVAYAKAFEGARKVNEIPVAFAKGQAPVEPTDANVKSGKYPISRYLYNYTRGNPTGLVKQYLDFVRGREGQAIVEKVGYVPL